MEARTLPGGLPGAGAADGADPDALDLAAIFAALPGATAAFANDPPRFTVLAASEALLVVSGRARAAVVGRPLAEAFPNASPEDPEASGLTSVRASLETVVRTGAPQRMPRQRYDLERPDGSWEERYWDAVNTPVPGPDGAVRYVLHQTEDVTARVRSEQAAAWAERRAEGILEAIADAYFALDADFRIVAVNAAMERNVGLPREALLGRSMWEAFPGTVGNVFEEHYRRTAAEQTPAHFTHEYFDGRLSLVTEVDLYPVPGGGVSAFWRDVTARVRAEAELRESEERFRLTTDAVPQIVWITDHEGRTEFFNKQWSAYTGVPYEPTTVAAVAADFVHPEDAAATLAAFAEACRTGGTFAVEHRIRSAAGDYRWFLVRAEPQRHPATGEVVRWFGASVDIHDRKEIERALRASEARQAFLLALQDRLLALVDVDAIQFEAARALGERLGASRVGYAEITADGEHARVTRSYAHRVPSIDGRHRVADYSPALLTALRAGRTVVRDHVARDATLTGVERSAYAALAVGASADLPLLRHGRLVGVLFAHFAEPHAWTPEELTLLADVAARTWDAVERARAEAAQRASEARYRTLVGSIDEGFCIIEVLFEEGDGSGPPRAVDYRFLEANPAFIGQTGLAEAVGRTIRELVPAHEAHWFEIYGRVARTGEPTRFEAPAEALGRWYDVHAVRVGEPEERRVAVLFTDIMPRKRAEAERERLLSVAAAERERLRRVILQTPGPLALLEGPEHRFALVNDAYKRVSGGGRDVTGLTPPEAFPELAGSEIHQLLDRVYETGEAWSGPETLLRYDRDGTGVMDTWFNLRFEPLRDADGRVTAIFNFAVDVTDQVLARRALEGLLDREQHARAAAEEASRIAEAARREAEGANRAKSEFLAVMSHELRTPLNAIGGYAELIELGIHGPVTDAQRTALERIQRSQRHLLGLIAGVLDYSRVEAGAVTYRLIDVPVAEAVAEAELLVAPQLRAKGLGYAWSGAAPGLCVRADREKLQQILLNLLGNAVKFTNPRDGVPGHIEVACTVASGHVRIHVRDTGDGIAPDGLERVFEPFVQADQRLTRAHAGVGLGLAISRDLARGMGGDLTAESTWGVGSTFTLTLPHA